MSHKLDAEAFQTTIDDKETDLFFLENEHGVRAAITNYGARIVAVWMPDKNGDLDNVVAGYDSISDYLESDKKYLGVAVGRYANRIKGASFELNGREYTLSENEGKNQLHGGKNGFHNAVWDAKQDEPNRVQLRHTSPDGTEGFPGKLDTAITYTLSDDDQIIIEYRAVCDKDTVLNVTNHAYFNLGGESNSIHARDHLLRINADRYTPKDADSIPTGEIAGLKGTPLDFRETERIGARLGSGESQLKIDEGYDHNYVLNKGAEDEYTLAAVATEPETGRLMMVHTTEPGVQLYECELDKALGLNVGSAFCLETQHFPDSPNQQDFPSTELKVGEEFYSKTAFAFLVEG
jgi:aldose 1-epimerase